MHETEATQTDGGSRESEAYHNQIWFGHVLEGALIWLGGMQSYSPWGAEACNFIKRFTFNNRDSCLKSFVLPARYETPISLRRDWTGGFNYQHNWNHLANNKGWGTNVNDKASLIRRAQATKRWKDKTYCVLHPYTQDWIRNGLNLRRACSCVFCWSRREIVRFAQNYLCRTNQTQANNCPLHVLLNQRRKQPKSVFHTEIDCRIYRDTRHNNVDFHKLTKWIERRFLGSFVAYHNWYEFAMISGEA